MQDLFGAELLRFRRWALALALAHLGWLCFVDRVADPLQQPALVYRAYLGLLALLGLFFGIHQLSAYARQAAWIGLLHRPLAPQRIGAALLLAGLALSGLATALPVALLLPFHQLSAGQGVESRHLLFPLAAWAVAATAYLIGVHLRLGPPRLAWTATVLLLWLYHAEAHGPAAVALQGVAVAIAFALALGDFRPDRNAPQSLHRQLATLGLASLALGMGCVLALRFAVQLGMMLLGTHPLNGVPPAGGLVEATRADGATLIALGLDAGGQPQHRFWAEQAALSEIVTLVPELRAVTPRYSLAQAGSSTVDDAAGHLQWQFSHDSMRYAATDQRTRRPWQPETLPPRLPAPPLATGDGGLIIAGHRLLHYDAARRQFFDRVALPPGERLIAAPEPAWDRLLLLSDQALRIYDRRVLQLGDKHLPPLAEVELPHPPGGLMRIDLLELLDAYLVSFTTGAGSVDGHGPAEQQLWLVEGRQARRVGGRMLGADYPDLMRHADLWLAPVITVAAHAARTVLGAPNAMAALGPRDVPPEIVALGLLVHLLAGLAGGLHAAGRAPGRRTRIAWATACLLLGPAMLAALLLAHKQRARC